MTQKERAITALMEYYRRVYEIADPPIDFAKDAHRLSKENRDWFYNHTISTADADRICEEVLAKYKLRKPYKDSFMFERYMGCGPKEI